MIPDIKTAQEALSLLERAVEERGAEHVYTRPADPSDDDTRKCLYSHGTEPGCLVGTALHLAGATVEELALLDIRHEGGVSAEALSEYFDCISEDAALVFQAAQTRQDDAYPWGEALDEARNHVERYDAEDEDE